MFTIDLPAMLQGEQNSAIYCGSSLKRIARYLGIPDRWDFGVEEIFTCQLGYKDLEINFTTQENQVVAERIWFKFWEGVGERQEVKSGRISVGRRISVKLGSFRPGLPLAEAKAALAGIKCRYVEEYWERGQYSIAYLHTANSAQLHFFPSTSGMVLMEIHFTGSVIVK